MTGDDERDVLRRIAELHPRVERPRYGCCASPQVCKGHDPECRGREHGLSKPAWPCPTMVVVLDVAHAEALEPFAAEHCCSTCGVGISPWGQTNCADCREVSS